MLRVKLRKERESMNLDRWKRKKRRASSLDRFIRQILGMTSQQLADELGVTLVTLNSWLRRATTFGGCYRDRTCGPFRVKEVLYR